MTQRPLVSIAAGGTAGHINPALALAEELRDHDFEVLFFGQATKLEGRLVPEAGFELCPVRVSGFDRSRPWTLASALMRINRARRIVNERFLTQRPVAACGFGAYVEVPLLSWCAAHGVPVLIHEQNSITGLANRMMAKRAQCVCVSYPEAKKAFEELVNASTRVVETGNPVRRSILHGNGERARALRHIPREAVVLVIFGGSLGAHSLNKAALRLGHELLLRPWLQIIHATGAEDYEAIQTAFEERSFPADRWHLSAYVEDMGDVLAAADLALCRSGASSVAELAATCVPSLLIPYPHATANHQKTNAAWLEEAGAALVMDDDELSSQTFTKTFLGLVDSPERRAQMAQAAQMLDSKMAAQRLCQEVIALAQSSIRAS